MDNQAISDIWSTVPPEGNYWTLLKDQDGWCVVNVNHYCLIRPLITEDGRFFEDDLLLPSEVLEWGEKIERGAYQKGFEDGHEQAFLEYEAK